MNETFPARVVRALSADHFIRMTTLNAAPLWDGVRRGHPQLGPEPCSVLVQLLSAALLLQARTFHSERLQLLLKGSGRAKAVVADAWPEGDVRGILDPGEAEDGPWVVAPGLMQVMRSNASGQPYVGHLELVEGGLEAQIEAYLQQSEQVQASLSLWCDPATGETGGLLVEPLPGCPPERLARMVDAIEGLEVVPLWERDTDFLVRWINQGDGAEILSSTEVRYHCRCSREALVGTLAAFPPDRVAELFHQTGQIQVHCDYCGKAYDITRSELHA